MGESAIAQASRAYLSTAKMIKGAVRIDSQGWKSTYASGAKLRFVRGIAMIGHGAPVPVCRVTFVAWHL